jgi:hypothetical protein
MTDIYQAGTKVWEEIEKWAANSSSSSNQCFLELRSRVEYLEKTLKEIAYDQLTTLSQELQGDEYKTLITKDQAYAALWGLLSGGDDTKKFFQDIETLYSFIKQRQ